MASFNIQINAKDNPNLVGEYLRHLFFKQDRVGPNYTFGCYSTFDLRENVVERPKQPVPEWGHSDDPDKLITFADETCEYHFTCAELESIDGTIKMLYYWDGDGFLSFILPDGSYLYNDDCKKDYGWKIVDNFENYWYTSAAI